MTTIKNKTYHLYAFPGKVEELTIGSLILGDYSKPLDEDKCYMHRALSDDELERFTRVTNLDNIGISKQRGKNLHASVGGFELGHIGLATGSNESLSVVAKTGRRIQLKEPKSFLNKEVLSCEDARDKLQLWLSAAASNYVEAAFGRLWSPAIRMLTGVYVLEDARTLSMTSKQAGESLEISPAVLGILAGTPVGGTVDIGKQCSIQVTMVVREEGVWAAQFRRLKVKYFWPGDKLDQLKAIPLYNTVETGGEAYDAVNLRNYSPPEFGAVSIRAADSKGDAPPNQAAWSESESEGSSE